MLKRDSCLASGAALDCIAGVVAGGEGASCGHARAGGDTSTGDSERDKSGGSRRLATGPPGMLA
jgi:hypothetical protein